MARLAILKGPVYLGQNVKVSEHAALKDEVCISHTCKVGGEVEAAVFEPYSNKQHYGFLGHSYVGSWVNLGAGTCNSDLKNTYGKVNMVYDGKKVATQMQFMGCIIGDYAKDRYSNRDFHWQADRRGQYGLRLGGRERAIVCQLCSNVWLDQFDVARGVDYDSAADVRSEINRATSVRHPADS